jgi:amidase
MTEDEYLSLDAVGIAGAVASGALEPSEVMAAASARIARCNPTLNAVVHSLEQEAAANLDKLPEGPLRGVPFLVKDLNLDWNGSPMTSGSRFLTSYRSTEDAPLASAFKGAGLVAMGKSNTPEFGITGTTESALFGPCRNPWDPERIAGGSSGGAAAAVASGMVPVAHASDGAGSIRIPAACCGLVGLMPSRGRTCSPGRAGDVHHSYSRHFVVSRSVRDSAAMLDAVADTSPYAPPREQRPFAQREAPGRLHIRWSAATPGKREAHPEIAACLEGTASLLQQLGHQVTQQPLAADYRRFYQQFNVIGAAQLAADIEDDGRSIGREPQPGDFEPLTERNLSYGRSRSGIKVVHALREMRAFTRAMDEQFSEFDVFVMPILAQPVPKLGYLDPVALTPEDQDRRSAEVFPYTPPFNATGQPAISLPMGTDSNGLPIGLQFIARFGREHLLLDLAAQLEQGRPWLPARLPDGLG